MKAKDKIHLVYINSVPYLMVNPYKNLTVGMCNSQVTKKWNITKKDLNKNVFEFFNVKLEIVQTHFDRRTSDFKSFEKKIKYFNVEYLQTLSELKTI